MRATTVISIILIITACFLIGYSLGFLDSKQMIDFYKNRCFIPSQPINLSAIDFTGGRIG